MIDKELHTEPGTLLAQIINGSEPAFERLFLDMYPALHRLAWRLTQREDVANDIVSDVFLKIWEQHSSLSHIKEIRSYLYATVRNHTLNYLKKRETNGQHTQEVAGHLQEQLSEDSLKALLDAETIRLLMAAIHNLPTECEKVVMLGLEGYSTSEIAAKLGISAPAVSQQKARAVKLLRGQLGSSMLTVLFFLLD